MSDRDYQWDIPDDWEMSRRRARRSWRRLRNERAKAGYVPAFLIARAGDFADPSGPFCGIMLVWVRAEEVDPGA